MYFSAYEPEFHFTASGVNQSSKILMEWNLGNIPPYQPSGKEKSCTHGIETAGQLSPFIVHLPLPLSSLAANVLCSSPSQLLGEISHKEIEIERDKQQGKAANSFPLLVFSTGQ